MRRGDGSDESPDDVEVIGEEEPDAETGRPTFPWWVPLVVLVAAVGLVVLLDRFLTDDRTPVPASPEPASEAGPGPRSLRGPPTGRFLLSLHGGGAAVSPGAVIGTDFEPIQLSPLGSDAFLTARPSRVGPTGRELGGWLELGVQGAELAQQGDPDPTIIARRDWQTRLIRARWSPLAERVAYLAHPGSLCTRETRGDRAEACVDVEGVAAVAASGGRLAWAPDGERLLLDGGGLQEVDVETGRVSELVPEGGGPAVRDEVGEVRALPAAGWSPSGRYAAASAMLTSGGYSTGIPSRDVPVVFDSEGRLAAVGREGTAESPSVPPRWSPEEDLLAYVAGSGDTDGDDLADEVVVLLLDPSTGESREVLSIETPTPRGVMDLEWSPDGEHLAVVRAVGGGSRLGGTEESTEIWVVDPTGDRRPGVIDANLIRLAIQDPLVDWGPTSIELTTAQRRLAEQRASDLGTSVGDYVSRILDEGL